VDLKGGDTEISDDLDGPAHHAAGQGSDREGAAAHRPVRDEGQVRLAVLASAVNVKANDATMNASLNLHGLDKLLEGYGIAVEKDVVLDMSCATRPPDSCRPPGGIAQAEFPQISPGPRTIRASRATSQLIDTKLPGALPTQDVAVPFASKPVAQERQAAGRERCRS